MYYSFAAIVVLVAASVLWRKYVIRTKLYNSMYMLILGSGTNH